MCTSLGMKLLDALIVFVSFLLCIALQYVFLTSTNICSIVDACSFVNLIEHIQSECS